MRFALPLIRRRPRQAAGAALGLILAAGLAGPAVRAQGAGEGGIRLDGAVSPSLVWSNDPEDVGIDESGGFFSRTGLALSLQSATRLQTLTFDATGALEYGDSLETTGLVDPSLNLSYAREVANARLDAFGQYRSSDLDDRETEFSLDLDGDGIVDAITPITVSGGTRETLRYGIGIETGLQAPFGFALDASRTEQSFADIDTLSLYDSTDTRLGVRATLEVDPRVTLRATAEARQFEAEDDVETDRTTTRANIGAQVAVDPVLTLDAALGWDRVETDTIEDSEVTEGASFDIGLTRSLPNGTLTTALTSGVDQNGRRDEITVSRALILPSEAELAVSLGAGRGGDFGFQPLLGLNYSRDLKVSRITASLEQSVRPDDEDTEVVDTRLSASYVRELSRTLDLALDAALSDTESQAEDGADRRQVNLGLSLGGEINTVSGWTAGLSYTETSISGGSDEREREDLGLDFGYRHAVVRDLDLVARYEVVARRDTRFEDRTDSTFSLGLEKTFSLRP